MRSSDGSFVPSQLPFSPMRSFAIRVELTHDVPVQRPHDANPRKHRRPAIFRREDQHLDRDLPSLGVLIGLR